MVDPNRRLSSSRPGPYSLVPVLSTLLHERLQNQRSRHLIHHPAMLLAGVAGFVKNLVGLARGQPLVPQVNRQTRSVLPARRQRPAFWRPAGSHRQTDALGCPLRFRPRQIAAPAAPGSADPPAGYAAAPASAPAEPSGPVHRTQPRQCGGCRRPGRDIEAEGQLPASRLLPSAYPPPTTICPLSPPSPVQSKQ